MVFAHCVIISELWLYFYACKFILFRLLLLPWYIVGDNRVLGFVKCLGVSHGSADYVI